MKTLHYLPLAMTFVACAEKAPPKGLEIAVAALELPGIEEAIYGLTVRNGSDEIVWQKGGLRSTQYGDGAGALTYIGTCDASDNPHAVTLVLESLWANGLSLEDPKDFRNPAPGPTGITLDGITCVENGDVRVTFDLTILRAAKQGFFDIAVEFQDVFCSAKLDCNDALLHDPADGERGPTAIVAFACTAGADDDDTYLYLNPARVVCGVAPDETRYTLYPDAEPGNQGALPPIAYQTATYLGQEAFTDFDKCYWNQAFGIDLDALAALAPCRIEMTGTASGTPFVNGQSPAGVYPIITWSVPIAIATDGTLECGTHPLNGIGSGVQTGYTQVGGEHFAYGYACGGDLIPPQGMTCTSTIDDQGVSVMMVGERDFVATVGATTSPTYRLPANLALARGEGCCVDPCCEAP